MPLAPTLYLLALEENRRLSRCFGNIFSKNNFSQNKFRENKLEKTEIFCIFSLTRFANSQQLQHVYFTKRQSDKA
jgi:hypothetical protein